MSTLIEAVEEFISGDWGAENYSPDSSNDVVCIRGADIEDVQGGIYHAIPVRYISSSSLTNKRLKAGDIVIEKSGGSPTQSTGRTCYISENLLKEKKDVVCSNFCAAFRIKETWDYKYIYYYIQNIYNQGNFFNFEGKTSGIRNLLLDTAFKSIPLPSIGKKDQTNLSRVLECLDQKIALNTRMNAELEAMAKQLYDYWFVQFDFPFDFAQGKPDENGKPYKSSGGKMVWNEKLKREIPEGWEESTLSEIANITMGQSPDGSTYNSNGNGIVFYQGSTDFGIRFPSVRMFTTAPTRFAKKGDILMSVRAPVGDTNIANMNCCIGRGLSALNSKIGSTTHLYHILGDLKAKFDQLNAAGTTFGSITKDELYSLPVVKPSSTVLLSFEDICSPMFEKQMKIGYEIEHLTHLRDSLLPMLMNGQVTIE